MKMTYYVVVMTILSFSFAAETEAAKVFRCKGEEVRKGDSTFTILQKCGEPAFKEVISAEGCEKVERWFYDCQGRRFVDELTFRAGVLKSHEEGERSTRTQLCK